ncbi:protein kinase [bacterium]|nr:protein kinase [bacterium]
MPAPVAQTRPPADPLEVDGWDTTPPQARTTPAVAPGDDGAVELYARPPADRAPRPVAVPGYEGLEEIGHGSMGVVYRARQVGLGRPVALKMILADPRGGREALERFTSEARILASLQHPNIVQIYDINLGHEPPYFSMELVEGGTLAARLGGRPQPVRAAAQLLLALARAVHVAHQGGIVHRDLKPGNVLIPAADTRASAADRMTAALGLRSPDAALGTPKITDFGLAKNLSAGADQTESGVIMGTPNYMAPEQAEGKSRDVGPAADVYSLGAILYEALTGRPPFVAESPVETFLQVFHAELVSPSRLQPKLPRDLETICLKCLHKIPARRYATAGELADDLQRFLSGESILARPTPVREKVAKWALRRPALAAAAGCAAAAVVGILGFGVWHQVELRARLGDAIRDERDSRAAEVAATERERLTGLRGTANGLVHAAEAALAAKDWAGARVALARAHEQVGGEPDLADLRDRVAGLQQRADRQRADHDRLEAFRDRRNDALFHATMFTGTGLAAAVRETSAAATAALMQFGVSPGTTTAPTVDSPFYTAAEKAEVTEGCYELLVVLADAVAQPRPGQSADDVRRQAVEAVVVLDRAAGLGRATQAFHRRRAQYLAQADQTDTATRERGLAAATLPTTPLDHFLLGQERYRAGEFTAAVGAFEGALQLQPDHFWARYFLGLTWLKARRPDQAVTCLTACLAQRREFPWLHLLRATALGELNQYDRAEADFDTALKVPLTEAGRYGLLVNRGAMRVRRGMTDAGAADFRAALALRPGQYQAHASLAQVHLQEREFDAAIARLDEAVRLEPGLASLYRTRALVRLIRQEPDAALADLDTALRLDPTAADDHLERGRILFKQKDYAGALAAADAAAVARPRDAKASRLRAEALVALERLPEALQALDDCLVHGPPDAGAFRARAAVRTQIGQYPGAQTDYTRALELNADAPTYAARGWCYLVAGAPRLALPDFDEAVRRAPELGDAYAGRGYARALLGDHQAAVADAEEALARGPQTPRLCYNVARVYAQAVARHDRQAVYVGTVDLARRAEWEERAVRVLTRALDQQPPADAAAFWRTVGTDRAFDAVRRGAGFGRLAARYPVPRRVE